MTSPQYPVTDHRQAARFEMQVDAQLCFIDYRRIEQQPQTTVDFLHAYVPPELRGRGLAEQLVSGALQLCQDRGERVIPSCSYVAAYVRRHRQWSSLLV